MSGRATPATQMAQKAGVQFTIHEYDHDPNTESFGLEAVEALGLDPQRVFKTLVATVDSKRVCAIVPVEKRLNLKSLAAAAGGKRAEMADPADAQRATGYVLGGISPLGQKTRLRTVLDASAVAHDTVFVSAGRRGLEIELSPQDLMKLTGASAAEIT